MSAGMSSWEPRLALYLVGAFLCTLCNLWYDLPLKKIKAAKSPLCVMLCALPGTVMENKLGMAPDGMELVLFGGGGKEIGLHP